MTTRLSRSAQLQTSNGPATGSTEGRRTPRLEVLGRIHGYIVERAATAVVTEIGSGGFRIVTDVAMPVGHVQEFRFTLGDGSVVFAPARTVHCRPEAMGGGEHRYIAGFAFVEPLWRGRSPDDLVDDMTSTLRFI